MATSGTSDLAARLAGIERELRELKLRVIALERLVGAGEEHPSDQTTVRRKVSYDWQG